VQTNGTTKQLDQAITRLGEAWVQFSQRFAADIKREGISIPGSQTYLLFLLSRRGPLRMSDIADRLGVTLSGCTAVVDRAVEEGWVERKRDSADRRVVRIRIAPAGEHVLLRMKETRLRLLRRYLEQLQPEEVNILVTLVNRLTETMESQQKTEH